MYDFRFPDAERFTAWFLVSQTRTAMTRVTEKELAKIGLTPEKAKVLWLCNDYPPPLTPAEISRFLFRKSHSVAGLLDRMERDGLVRRVPKRKGHPFTEIQLTEKGRELVGWLNMHLQCIQANDWGGKPPIELVTESSDRYDQLDAAVKIKWGDFK